MNLGTEWGEEDTYFQVANADCVPSAVPRRGAPTDTPRSPALAATGPTASCRCWQTLERHRRSDFSWVSQATGPLFHNAGLDLGGKLSPNTS